MGNFKEKMKQAKTRAKEKAQDVGAKISDFYYNNQDMCKTGAVVGVTLFSIFAGIKHDKMKYKEYNRDRRVYDPSTGVYIEVKRPLKNWQKVELAHRKEGQTVTEKLEEMRLIK